MNMASPMTKKIYDSLASDIHLAYVGASQESMLKASEEIKCRIIGTDSPGEMVADSDVLLDGTWQKRGHSSVNGIVMAISKETGKCVDVAVLSKECKACQYWSHKKGTVAFNIWQAGHNCLINHTKSSGSMEAALAIKILKQSIATNKLRYKTYVGDGDTQSYADVVKSDPYPGLHIKTGE